MWFLYIIISLLTKTVFVFSFRYSDSLFYSVLSSWRVLDRGSMALVFVDLFVFVCYFVFVFRVTCPVSYFIEINPNISALAASRVLVRDL